MTHRDALPGFSARSVRCDFSFSSPVTDDPAADDTDRFPWPEAVKEDARCAIPTLS